MCCSFDSVRSHKSVRKKASKQASKQASNYVENVTFFQIIYACFSVEFQV